MSNIQKQHKISPAIAWLTIQKFIIFYCPLDGEHTKTFAGVSFLAPFWHRWSDFSILNLSVFHLTDKCFAISNLINLRTILFLEYRKTPETLRFRGILRLDTMLSCDNKSIFRLYYSMIVATRPDPTVRPPSRNYFIIVWYILFDFICFHCSF